MYSSNVTQLVDIFSHLDIYILIVIRTLGFVFVMPVIGGRTIPSMAKVGFSLALAGIIYMAGIDSAVVYEDSIAGYALLLAQEFFAGLIIGFIVFVVFNILYLAGFYTDQQIGLSMSNILDPMSQVQVPIVGNLYYFIVSLIFIATSGHHKIIHMFAKSYELIGLGETVLVGNAGLFGVFLDIMAYFYMMGIRIAMPVIGTIFVLDVALGILVKAAPKINIFVVGIPIKLMCGLLLIYVISPTLANMYDGMIDNTVRYVSEAIEVMVP